jgi:hypothetical protein
MPPTTDSSLVNISYTLQLFVSYKGFSLLDKKPLIELPMQF